jgi:hypothetical protein
LFKNVVRQLKTLKQYFSFAEVERFMGNLAVGQLMMLHIGFKNNTSIVFFAVIKEVRLAVNS